MAVREVLLLGLLVASAASTGGVEVEGVDYILRDDIMVEVNHRGAHTLSSIGDTDPEKLWPGGVAAWTISTEATSKKYALEEDEARILWAVAHIEARTCIRLPRCTPPCNGSHIMFVADDSSCSSYIGRRSEGKVNQINISPSCRKGSVVHEILHALGAKHEQSRNDRDDHVFVDFSEIKYDKFNNFEKTGESGRDVLEYDYGSIMHYSPWGFTRSTARTIITPRPTGQRIGLSPLDIESVHFQYNDCKPFAKPRCVVSKKDDGPTLIPYGTNFSVEFNGVGRGDLSVWYTGTTAPGVHAPVAVGTKMNTNAVAHLTFKPKREHVGKDYVLSTTFKGEDGEATCDFHVRVVSTTAVCGGLAADDPKVCSGRGRCVGGQRRPCECEPGWGGQYCEGPVSCPKDETWNFDSVGDDAFAVSGAAVSMEGSEYQYLNLPYTMQPRWITASISRMSNTSTRDPRLALRNYPTWCTRIYLEKDHIGDTRNFHHVAFGFDWARGTTDVYVDNEWKALSTFDEECSAGVDRLILSYNSYWDDLHVRCEDFVDVEGAGDVSVLRMHKGGHRLRYTLKGGDEWVDTVEVKRAILASFAPENASLPSGWGALQAQILDESLVTIEKNVLTIGPFRAAKGYDVELPETVSFSFPPAAVKSGKLPLLRKGDTQLVIASHPTPTATVTPTILPTPAPTPVPRPPEQPSSPSTVDRDVFLGVVIPLAVVLLILVVTQSVTLYKLLNKPTADPENPNRPDKQ